MKRLSFPSLQERDIAVIPRRVGPYLRAFFLYVFGGVLSFLLFTAEPSTSLLWDELFSQDIMAFVMPVIGAILLAGSVVGAVVCFLTLLPGGCWVRVRRDGFDVCRSFKVTPHAWHEVSAFHLGKLPLGSRYVHYDVLEKGKLKEHIMPDLKGYTTEEQTELFNYWRKADVGFAPVRYHKG